MSGCRWRRLLWRTTVGDGAQWPWYREYTSGRAPSQRRYRWGGDERSRTTEVATTLTARSNGSGSSVFVSARRRWLHRSADRGEESGMSRPTAADWSEHAFLKQADHTLESIREAVEGEVDDKGMEIDVDLSMGVLTINLGSEMGTYVLNTQTPNRQLWLSSPKSGPARYYWHEHHGQWLCTRDEHPLRRRLHEELSQSCDIAVPETED